MRLEAAPVRLALLGGFELTHCGEPVPLVSGAQRLLAFLALQKHPLPRAYVAGTLWSDVTDGRAGGNLRSALWRIRLPGVSIIRAERDRVQLDPCVAVDVREAEDLAAALMAPDPTSLDDDGCERLTGELLPGWYDDWVLLERERHRQLALHALERACERLIDLSRFGSAVLAGLAAVREEPLRESAQRVLIKAYLAEGNSVEAIRQYRSYESLLRSELRLEPSPSLAGLMASLVR